MTTSGCFARFTMFGLTLAACAILLPAQDNGEQQKKAERRAEPRERSAPAAQHKEAPARQRPENAQPRMRRENAPEQRQTAPAQQPQQQPRREAPARVDQPRPNAQENRAPQPPTPADRPGRTFGNPPNRDSSPNSGGRTFGTPPGRPADVRGPVSGSRPMTQSPRTFTTRTGDVIHRDSNGQVRQVRMNNGTMVYHPSGAPRRVEAVRPGGRVIVAGAPGHGYVQRPVVFQNTTIIKRTYIYNGVPQARIYRPRVYNGITLAVYTPVRYYHPAFYAYVYNPWPRPIVYSWGWSGRPWYGYYGGYFTPYPVYASPSLWLTDFMIAAMLESAYEERMASRAYATSQYDDGGQPAPMTPEVKQAIADEVRRQIEREKADGQMAGNLNGGPDNSAFDNGSHVFVANAALTVASNNGECSIREGDVLQLNGAPPPDANAAELIVLSSRRQDCAKGSAVSVQLQDLQEMQNQMRATLDRGLGDLQAKQGQGGLPQLPQGAAGAIYTPLAREAQPDSDTASQLAEVSREADSAEQQAISQSAGAPPVLTLGMSVDDVRSIQGEPQKIVDLGERKMYVYKDLKITFIGGKVSDIQ